MKEIKNTVVVDDRDKDDVNDYVDCVSQITIIGNMIQRKPMSEQG